MATAAPMLDLPEVLSFQRGGGIIRFVGKRAIILDSVALGLMRRELVENLGMKAARGILMRMGYAAGRNVAQALQEEHPNLWKEGKVGPSLTPLGGQLVPAGSTRSDGREGRPLIQSYGEDGFEAEQHLLHFGRADHACCWFTSGYASGYVSYREQREVVFVETECIAQGHPLCCMVGRYREAWGSEVEEDLRQLHLGTIDSKLAELSTRLQESERKLAEHHRELGFWTGESDGPVGAVARSPAIRLAFERARRFAHTASSVLITGESGVGKEVLARYIHAQSPRASGPFISLNCGAVPETLLESELFGHAKGAFTGADAPAIGLFEAANGGTLFLDEVGELTQATQVKLLRALQEREVRRVGESKARPIDVRILSATNRDLKEAMQAGTFRQDLYFRLHVIELPVPPLRERPEDVVPLARAFLARQGSSACCFSRPALERLMRYGWPGNVRELQNVLEHAAALCTGDRIEVEDLPPELQDGAPAGTRASSSQRLEDVEREHILSVLRAQHGNRAQAARTLGIGISTLYRRLRESGLEEGEPEPVKLSGHRSD